MLVYRQRSMFENLRTGTERGSMATSKSGSSQGMEDNLKKAVTEMLVLVLLDDRDMYAGELLQNLEQRSGGALSIVFP